MEIFKINSNNLSGVTPASLAQAVVTLKKVDLRYDSLTPPQCQVLMNTIKNADVKTLEILIVGGNNLSQVSSVSLAEAVLTLREVKLSSPTSGGRPRHTKQEVRPGQCQVLANSIISRQGGKLEKLVVPLLMKIVVGLDVWQQIKQMITLEWV